ncbi:hypothetical protein FKM82_024870 [Ascaphus truei]
MGKFLGNWHPRHHTGLTHSPHIWQARLPGLDGRAKASLAPRMWKTYTNARQKGLEIKKEGKERGQTKKMGFYWLQFVQLLKTPG